MTFNSITEWSKVFKITQKLFETFKLLEFSNFEIEDKFSNGWSKYLVFVMIIENIYSYFLTFPYFPFVFETVNARSVLPRN